MNIDLRALCAELIDALDSGIPAARIRMSPLAGRARALLAEPEPPSLKQQALGALYAIATGADDTKEFYQDIETIKSALEQLDD